MASSWGPGVPSRLIQSYSSPRYRITTPGVGGGGWGQDKQVLLDADNSPHKPVVSQGLSFWGPPLPHPTLHDAGLRVCPCKTCGCIPGLYTPLDVTTKNVTRPCPCALGAGLRPADLGFTPPPPESPGHTPAPPIVSTACLTFQRYIL